MSETTDEENQVFPHSPEQLHLLRHSYQCWKRLHWCRSKVNSAFQVASLMAMFSLIATVEIPLPQGDKEASPNLVIAFVCTSSSLVSVTVLVKVISTQVLPYLDTIAEMSVNESVESPHDQILSLISVTCILGHTVAPILFCVDVILVSWIKYPKFAEYAPFASTFILFPLIVVILRFGVEFYKQMKQFRETRALNFGYVLRYTRIADRWDKDSVGDSPISRSIEIDHESSEGEQLVKSYQSVTSYGAVVQSEFIGSPNSAFADFI